jgi:2-dehydropantoate 2-reductase
VVVRGAHLAAVRERGLRLRDEGGGERAARLPASDRIADFGPQDVVILGMKAHQLPPVAAELPALFGPETCVVTAQNGVPWWYFHKHGGEFEGRRIEAVDPGGAVSAQLEVSRVIGCVVYSACELVAPGVIQVIEGSRFSLGELDGSDSERVRALAIALREAGLKAPITSDIRSELWLKLWGNLCFNPISALTQATLVDICEFPPTRALAAAMMREAQTLGEKLGVRFKLSLERRIAGAAAVGKHRTSMLQDVEAGRALELEALVGAVIELGRIAGVATPAIEHVYALAALLGKTLGEARAGLRLVPS